MYVRCMVAYRSVLLDCYLSSHLAFFQPCPRSLCKPLVTCLLYPEWYPPSLAGVLATLLLASRRRLASAFKACARARSEFSRLFVELSRLCVLDDVLLVLADGGGGGGALCSSAAFFHAGISPRLLRALRIGGPLSLSSTRGVSSHRLRLSGACCFFLRNHSTLTSGSWVRLSSESLNVSSST